jgi:hypothetical protein
MIENPSQVMLKTEVNSDRNASVLKELVLLDWIKHFVAKTTETLSAMLEAPREVVNAAYWSGEIKTARAEITIRFYLPIHGPVLARLWHSRCKVQRTRDIHLRGSVDRKFRNDKARPTSCVNLSY